MGFCIVFQCFKYSLMRYNLNGSSRNGEGSFTKKPRQVLFGHQQTSPHSNQLDRKRKHTRQVGKQFY